MSKLIFSVGRANQATFSIEDVADLDGYVIQFVARDSVADYDVVVDTGAKINKTFTVSGTMETYTMNFTAEECKIPMVDYFFNTVATSGSGTESTSLTGILSIVDSPVRS